MNQEQELIDHPLAEDEQRELEGGDDDGEEEEELLILQQTTTTTTPAAVYSSSHHHNNNEINHRLCSNCGYHKRRSPESFKQSRNKKPTNHVASLPGFSKIPLPTQDQPLLRRCTSTDPISPPNVVQPVLHDPPQTPLQNLEVPETPLSARGSAAKLPPRAPTLRRTISDPSPSTSAIGGVFENPDDKRLRRMRDCIRVMNKWWDEILPEEQHDAPIIKNNNSIPGTMENSDEDIEESVSVERSGDFLIIHFKCPCGKGYQILLSGKNCYYKLM